MLVQLHERYTLKVQNDKVEIDAQTSIFTLSSQATEVHIVFKC